MTEVSIADYARHRGLSAQAVMDAIAQGQIKSEKRKGRVWIDKEQADIDWAANRATRADKDGSSNYAKARAIREQATAELAVLKVAEEKRKLVRVETVEREGFEVARQIRNALLNIPAKIAPEVAAEVDPHAVEIILAREINQALETITKIMGSDNTPE